MIQIQQILNEYKIKGFDLIFISDIKSGKEAQVFKVKSDDEFFALKIYKKPEERTFKNNYDYLAGKFYKNKSERRSVKAKNSFSKKLIHSNWVRREFFMLDKIYGLGGNIPKPIDFTIDSILMELIGDENNIACKLQDIELDKKEAVVLFEKIMDNIGIFLEIGIIHGDLSAFNILYNNSEIFIIDFPQSLDIRTNPNSSEFLMRDIKNVCDYFRKYIEIDDNAIFKRFSDKLNIN